MRPNVSQIESSTIYHISQEAIAQTQLPVFQYTSQQAMHHLPIQQSIQHTEPSTMSHMSQ